MVLKVRITQSIRTPSNFTRPYTKPHSNYTPHPRPPLHTLPLSPRQRQCMDLTCIGRTPKQIASELHLNIRTVQEHLALALIKLQSRTLPEASVKHTLNTHNLHRHILSINPLIMIYSSHPKQEQIEPQVVRPIGDVE